MSSTGTPVTASTFLKTVETDLAAGVSWLENEALGAASALWNVLKAAFIALEPAEGQILVSVLTGAVANAAGGKSIEEIETSALNTASADEKAVLGKAGTGVVQTVIAGIKATLPTSPTP